VIKENLIKRDKLKRKGENRPGKVTQKRQGTLGSGWQRVGENFSSGRIRTVEGYGCGGGCWIGQWA
jgi:hypothetical protein